MNKAGTLLRFALTIALMVTLYFGATGAAFAQAAFGDTVHYGHYTYTYDAFGNVTSTTWVELYTGTYGGYLTSSVYNTPGNTLLDSAMATYTPPSNTGIISSSCAGATGAALATCQATANELNKVIHQGYYTYTYDAYGNVIGSVWNEVWTGTQVDWFTSPYQSGSYYVYDPSGGYYVTLTTIDDLGNPFTPLTQADFMAQTQATANNPGLIGSYMPPATAITPSTYPKNTSEYPTPGFSYPPAGSYPPLATTATTACADTRTDAADGKPSAAAGSTAQMGNDTKLIAANLDAWGQDKLKVRTNSMAAVRPINIAADYCVQKLLDLFQQIGDLAGFGVSDMSTALTKVIVDKVIAYIATALSKSCTIIAGDLSGAFAALQTDASNAFCLPLPGLDITGINATGIKVPTIPCNGTSILPIVGPGPWSAPTNAANGYQRYKLFGK